MILGAADYQRIKTTEPPVMGANPDLDPGAEYTHSESEKIFFMTLPQNEFEKMWSLEVFGLCDNEKENKEFHADFKEKLERLDDGTYSPR